MRCIFCSLDSSPSQEHIFPRAIGGTTTTDRVCASCNSILGRRVDSALINFLPVRTRRAELGLAGNSGEPPSLFDMFLGEQTLVGRDENRIRTSFNKETGKLDHRLLHHAMDVLTPDGKKARKITIDERDIGQIPKIIQRERKRHDLPPLSAEELSVEASKYTRDTIECPLVKMDVGVSFAFLEHAMIKIAYELAFLWLGESYLDDPLAVELREAVMKDDIAGADSLAIYVGWAESCSLFNLWTPHKAHHLAFAFAVDDVVIVAVRVFDIYAAVIPVSRSPDRYARTGAAAMQLPFLAIDAATGHTVETTFSEEQLRLTREMAKHKRPPPFPDPLPT